MITGHPAPAVRPSDDFLDLSTKGAQIKSCYAEIRSFPPFAISAKFFFAVSVGERRFSRRAGLVFHGERIAGRTVEVVEPEALLSRDDGLSSYAGNS